MDSRRVRVARALAVGLAMCASFLALSPSSSEARLDNVTVKAVDMVVVRVQVRAGSDQLVIPSCGADEAQVDHLCGMAVALEVHSDQGWHPAKPTPDMGILGGMPLSKARPKVIPTDGSAAFVYQFAKRVFVIKEGQQARLVVDAWANAEGIGMLAPSVRLVGQSFVIP